MLKTIVDLGPAATADRDFSDTAADVLERALQALDAEQGALFLFDANAARLSCVATQGFDALMGGADIQLAGAQSQRWMDSHRPVPLRSGEARSFLGTHHAAFVNSVLCVAPLRVGAALVGALCLGGRNQQDIYGDTEIEDLELLSSHLALLLQNHSLRESLKIQVADNLRLLSSLTHSYDDTLEAFATTIDAKVAHMRGHSMRVGRYAASIAESLGMGEDEITSIRASGQLHDIGKVTVDKAISNKTTSLRPEEFREIADHTVTGHQIVSSVRFPWPLIPEVVRWHHERADGSGYPDKIHSGELPLPVRIIGVCDTFDAMTSERPYRQPMSVLQAAQELVRLSPTKFDSSVVQGLLVQLHRSNNDDKNGICTAGNQSGPLMSAMELDRLSVTLLKKLTGNRVYSA